MKTFIRIAMRVVSYLYARNKHDFASTYVPSVHCPHWQGAECPDGHARMIIWQDFLDGQWWMSGMVGGFHRRRVNFLLTIEDGY